MVLVWSKARAMRHSLHRAWCLAFCCLEVPGYCYFAALSAAAASAGSSALQHDRHIARQQFFTAAPLASGEPARSVGLFALWACSLCQSARCDPARWCAWQLPNHPFKSPNIRGGWLVAWVGCLVGCLVGFAVLPLHRFYGIAQCGVGRVEYTSAGICKIRIKIKIARWPLVRHRVGERPDGFLVFLTHNTARAGVFCKKSETALNPSWRVHLDGSRKPRLIITIACHYHVPYIYLMPLILLLPFAIDHGACKTKTKTPACLISQGAVALLFFFILFLIAEGAVTTVFVFWPCKRRRIWRFRNRRIWKLEISSLLTWGSPGGRRFRELAPN